METVDWGYVVTTLVIRYTAIFIVLSLLIVLLTLNGFIISKLSTWKEKKEAALQTAATKDKQISKAPKSLQKDHNVAVAIGLALCLYRRYSTPPMLDDPEAGGQWRIAGRNAQWRTRIR